ncbi:hypothetical protein GCM10009682_22020 [Luedemannella flava]|uniref:Uncharacterized protein n=1 Tax=Luedemannella flava TaxID=349316 RepID=A0ABN2LVK9_9ACTN
MSALTVDQPTRTARAGAPAWPAAVFLAVVAVVALRAGHTPWGDIARYAGYLAYAVVLPGTLVFRALRRTPHTLLEDLAYGAVTGLTLEIGAWAALSAAGLRSWLWAWPLGVVAAFVAVPRLRGHWRVRGYTPVPAAVAWAVAAVGAGFLAYLWVVFLRPTPIVPGGEDQALYVDLPFQLSLAGEAKHHFPMHVPQVAGEPLHYHVFAFAHQAMASLVSGVDLTAVVFRLDVPALCLLAIVALVVTGWRVSGRAWVGVGAAALTFTVGEFGFADPVTFPFGTIATFIVWSSQSMTYSWVLLIAVVGVLADLVARGPEHRVPALGRGGWVLFTLLAVASVGAKASSLPVALGGLAVLGAWRLVTRRRIGWEVAAASGIGVAAQVFGNAVLFAFETHGMTVRPLWGPDRFFPEGGGAAAVAGIALAFTAVMLLRLAGLPVLLRLRGRRLGDAEVLLTGGMLAGIGAYLVFAHPGDANQYFIRAGWMFGVVASAWGWVLAAERSGLAGSGAAARQWRGWLAFGAALVCLGLLWAQFTYAADQTAAAGAFGPLVPALSWLLVLAIVAAVAGLWWRAVATGPLRDLRGRGGFVLLTAVLLAGAPGLVMEARTGWSHPNGGGYAPVGLPASRVEAARWLRDHSDPDDVVATNAHCLYRTASGACDSRSFWISAYAERRVLVEGWLFAPRATAAGAFTTGVYTPFWDDELLALNDAAFAAPTADGLAALRDTHGVRWLLADHTSADGPESEGLASLAAKVFDNGRVAIYRMPG